MEISEEKAIEFLKKHFSSEGAFKKVLAHSKKVQEIALRVAEKIPGADREFIKIACILHDVGRSKCRPHIEDSIKHGIIGAEILREEGLDEYANVAERHLGVGISKEDIKKQKLDIPPKDYVPETTEERIISYADNLVFGDEEGTEEMVVERFAKEIGPEYGEKVKKFNEEIRKLME